MRTLWVLLHALPLVVVAVRPTSLRRGGLAGRSVSPQAFPRVRFMPGVFLPLSWASASSAKGGALLPLSPSGYLATCEGEGGACVKTR